MWANARVFPLFKAIYGGESSLLNPFMAWRDYNFSWKSIWLSWISEAVQFAAATVFQWTRAGRPDNTQQETLNRKRTWNSKHQTALGKHTSVRFTVKEAVAWDYITPAMVVKKTCCLSFLLFLSQFFLESQISSLHPRSYPLPYTSLPYSLISSSSALCSLHPLFSCFAAQRGAQPWIPSASCHVKTLIPAKFHTHRLHLWLKEH